MDESFNRLEEPLQQTFELFAFPNRCKICCFPLLATHARWLRPI
jgi:hypothetical protein